MTVWAIIHSATRLIYGLTTDEPPQVVPGAEAVAVPYDTDLAGGPYVLGEGGALARASEQQVRDAFAGQGQGIVDYMLAVWADGA